MKHPAVRLIAAFMLLLCASLATHTHPAVAGVDAALDPFNFNSQITRFADGTETALLTNPINNLVAFDVTKTITLSATDPHLAAGRAFLVTVGGVVTPGTAGAFSVGLLLNGTARVTATTGANLAAATPNSAWKATFTLFIRTQGSSGIIIADAVIFAQTAINGTASVSGIGPGLPVLAVPLNTTTALTIVPGAMFGTSNAGNTTAVEYMIVQAIN